MVYGKIYIPEEKFARLPVYEVTPLQPCNNHQSAAVIVVLFIRHNDKRNTGNFHAALP